jgi:hypothetical protein
VLGFVVTVDVLVGFSVDIKSESEPYGDVFVDVFVPMTVVVFVDVPTLVD